MIRLKKPMGIAAGLLLTAWFWFSLPAALFNKPLSLVLEDRNGVLMDASIAADGQWRFPPGKAVPEKFKKCIVAFEDKRFWFHPGIDPVSLVRALMTDFKAGRYVSGASTISMQVMRMAMQKNRTVYQKVLESILALRLELSYSKEQILGLYASNAPFGTNVIGLDAAAWRYYGRDPSSLSWGETAALAILPNSPSLVHPGRNAVMLKQKRDRLLRLLVSNQTISGQTGELAMAEPVPEKPHALPQFAPHLLARIAHSAPLTGNYHFQSTLDIKLQREVCALVEKTSALLRGRQIANAAALVLDVETGEVLAYVGNTWHPEEPLIDSEVDVIQAPRSPGSTLKPILYTLMMQEGFLLPRSLIPDVPTYIAGYNPQNFDLGYDGAVPASLALSRSLNIPAVKMLVQYKYARFYDKLKGLGFKVMNRGADNYGLSLILGGAETNLWELSSTYASMARSLGHYSKYHNQYDPGDVHAPFYLKRSSSGLSGGLAGEAGLTLEKSGFFSAGALWYTFEAMEEVGRPGEEAWWRQFSSAYRLAWKTGTSFGFRDGWAIGLTPRYVVGVWVGNTSGEGRPGLTGISTAAPLLFDIFRLLPQGRWFEKPSADLVTVEACRESGYKSGPYCEHRVLQDVPRGGLRAGLCPYHQQVFLDSVSGLQVDASCSPVTLMKPHNWFVLPPVMEYYYRLRHPGYAALPSFKARCSLNSSAGLAVGPAAQTDRTLELIYPMENARIYVPLEIDGKRGRVILSAASRNTGKILYWNLDSRFIGTTRDFHQIAVDPSPGKHLLTVVAENGERLERHFEVLEKMP